MSSPASMDMDTQTSPGSSGFVLSEYICRYDGITKALRLMFIASTQTCHFVEACQLLNEYLLNSVNTSLYADFLRTFQDNSAFTISPNTVWLDATNQRNAVKLAQLEQELTSAESSLAKEPIRCSFNDLAFHHFETGNLQAALRCFHESKLYNTTPKHIQDMTINILSTLIHMGRGAYLSNFLIKSSSELEGGDKDKMQFCIGLNALYAKDYTSAARHFTDISPQIAQATFEPTQPNRGPHINTQCVFTSCR